MSMSFARFSLVFAGIGGATGVAADAWVTHAGASSLSADAARLMEIAVRYQLLHAVALLALAGLHAALPGRLLRLAGLLFVVGTLLFCGSLYLLALTDLRGLGMAAPLGGLSFVAAWLMVALHAARVLR